MSHVNMTFSIRLTIALALLLHAADESARADPPLANYVFPAGGQRGASVAVNVGGCDLNQECA